MRLVTYSSPVSGSPRLGVRVGHRVLDVESASRVDGEPIPPTLRGLLREGRGALSRVRALAKAARTSAGRFSGAMLEEGAIRFWPPLPDSDRMLRLDGEARSWRPIDGACLAGHNARVARSAGATRCEPRLGFVVGRDTGDFTPDQDVMDYVAGVTLLLVLAGEGASEAVVIGPELVTLDEVGDLDEQWLSCSVNGQVVLRGSPREHPGRLARALATPEPAAPGDLLAMACGAADLPPLRPGDTVECAIEGITTLRATMVAG